MSDENEQNQQDDEKRRDTRRDSRKPEEEEVTTEERPVKPEDESIYPPGEYPGTGTFGYGVPEPAPEQQRRS